MPSPGPKDEDIKIKNKTTFLSRTLWFSGKHVKTKTGKQSITLKGRSGTEIKAKIPVAWVKEGLFPLWDRKRCRQVAPALPVPCSPLHLLPDSSHLISAQNFGRIDRALENFRKISGLTSSGASSVMRSIRAPLSGSPSQRIHQVPTHSSQWRMNLAMTQKLPF